MRNLCYSTPIILQSLFLFSDCLADNGFGTKSSAVVASAASSIQTIAKVTDLSDSLSEPPQPGTLRATLRNAAPGTTITFDRAGTINLLAPLDISTADVTIDGTSNPIVIAGDSIRIKASRVTLRHLWIFAGDAAPSGSRPGVNGHSKPGERDAITVFGPDSADGSAVEDITIDHCWIGFGIDECLSTYGKVEGLSVTNSIIGYGLNRSLHPKDLADAEVPGHGKGILLGLHAKNITFRGNLLLHNFDRNIAVREGVENVSFINNVVYNFGRGNTFTVAGKGIPPSSGTFAGNVYIAGSESWAKIPPFRPADAETAKSFQAFGNIGTIEPQADIPHALSIDLKEGEKARLSQLKIAYPDKAFHDVLHTAGPHPALSDALSKRAVSDVFRRTGKVIDYVSEPKNPAATTGLGLDISLDGLVPPARVSSYKFIEGGVRVVP